MVTDNAGHISIIYHNKNELNIVYLNQVDFLRALKIVFDQNPGVNTVE